MTGGREEEGVMEEHTRNGLAKVADLLFPGSRRLPSGSQADAHGALLDLVLDADPRLLDAVLSVGEAAAASDACTLDDLTVWAGDGVESVVFALTSAYYISPQVLSALNYPGQRRRPIAQATPEERYSEELLAPVRERGAIFVPTP